MIDRTYAEIDVDALRDNIRIVREIVGDEVKILCLVKAQAYGHGAVAVATYCQDLLDYLGVATVDEAIGLRRSGIKLPILVVSDVSPDRYDDALRYDVELTVHSQESAISLDAFCKRVGERAKVHLAVDSGMGRIGFLPDEIDVAARAYELANLHFVGIFTHFAKADEADKTYTRKQKKVFDDFVSNLRSRGIDVGLCHIANSASILDMRDCNYQMARMGIMTYGLFPSEQLSGTAKLRPAMSWRARISHIKTLPKGNSIGYGGAYTTTRKTTVATVAVGYGDGYPRALSNKGYMLIGGKKAPILGRICMDQTMVDVTDIAGVKVGDTATLMGEQGEERISAEQLANWANTINYEIVCGVAKRVPRIYVKKD